VFKKYSFRDVLNIFYVSSVVGFYDRFVFNYAFVIYIVHEMG